MYQYHNLTVRGMVGSRGEGVCVCVWGGGGRGGGKGCCTEWVMGNFGVIVVRVCETEFRNLPHSYTWPLRKWSHSYTWLSKMLTYSYTFLLFLYPFIAGIRCTSVNSLKTKRTSSLEKSLSEKCQKSWAFPIWIKKNIIYLAALKKGDIRYAHPYYVIYR